MFVSNAFSAFAFFAIFSGLILNVSITIHISCKHLKNKSSECEIRKPVGSFGGVSFTSLLFHLLRRGEADLQACLVADLRKRLLARFCSLLLVLIFRNEVSWSRRISACSERPTPAPPPPPVCCHQSRVSLWLLPIPPTYPLLSRDDRLRT